MTKLEEAYKMVYKDMMGSECRLLRGTFDAKNGSRDFIYGICTVMEWIADRAGEEEYDEYSKLWPANVIKSEREAEFK